MLPELLYECLKYDGIVSIATCSSDCKAHIVNTWNKYLIITEDEKFLIPAFGMRQTERNCNEHPYMEVTLGSEHVQGKMGMGTGFLLTGTGEFLREGPLYTQMHDKCDFTNRVLVFKPETCKQTV